jgi:hypothetical protein
VRWRPLQLGVARVGGEAGAPFDVAALALRRIPF